MSVQEISKSIQDAIKASLPSAVADELQSFIAQAKLDKEKLDQLIKVNEVLANKIAELEKSNSALAKQLGLHNEISEREKVVSERENKLAVTIAELERDNAKSTTSNIKELVSLVFRNPTITTYESKSVPVPVNGYVSSHQENSTKSVTINP